MNVSYYCQHVLGIGHFYRSLEICKAIALRHPTTLILGGPPVEIEAPALKLLRLPGLGMDSEFSAMIPCDPGRPLEEVKQQRIKQLFSHFHRNRPDVFITELYPFGRKAFRFEIDPILSGIRDGSLPHCLTYCSVRDILVEKKTGREKFEARVVKTLNTYFDGILIHADPEVITLDETFDRMADIRIPLHYTGFVTQRPEALNGESIRHRLGLGSDDRLIVASIGGGNVGSELLYCTLDAFNTLDDIQRSHLQLFCGPYCSESIFEDLQKRCRHNITLRRFTTRFPEWLSAADLSISMAGYNTCMNLVQAGLPALVYPFDRNREQLLRAERLGRRTGITVLGTGELSPRVLARQMTKALSMSRSVNDINTDGAGGTAAQLDTWISEQSNHG